MARRIQGVHCSSVYPEYVLFEALATVNPAVGPEKRADARLYPPDPHPKDVGEESFPAYPIPREPGQARQYRPPSIVLDDAKHIHGTCTFEPDGFVDKFSSYPHLFLQFKGPESRGHTLDAAYKPQAHAVSNGSVYPYWIGNSPKNALSAPLAYGKLRAQRLQPTA
ncbi:hypothetical protein COCCADRAFT_23990 [Bipolaris zeicola 26-R-13]|uniref:Uncharacterized protein n=1 Tax=Cochliobolus carbonum (strain 26-R-13) TaxID=930089 RepID=W6YF17_COCC2|nr:uncharacterized protein COCCADRAFT_23990 [Bipolaris zeicola 26-R-13]EUC36250.1 hypothetical protein COCCADRAFT_23990 [Bipolaris zeicola 26-R-13]